MAAIALLLAATTAAAFELEAGTWSGPAYPQGSAAVVTVNLTYDCGSLTPAGEEIAITHTLDGNGTVAVAPESLSVQTLPDCTPGAVVTESVVVTYNAGDEMLAGSTATITLQATGPGLSGAEEAEETLTATIGPRLEVTYEPENATQQVPPGGTASFSIQVVSQSNDEIMTMVNVEVPAGWPEAAAAPVTVPSPFVPGEDGMEALVVDVDVPANATAGDHTVTVRVFSHSVATPSVETAEVAIPLTVSVEETPEDPDENDGPAPAVAIVLIAVGALAALARRRRT